MRFWKLEIGCALEVILRAKGDFFFFQTGSCCFSIPTPKALIRCKHRKGFPSLAATLPLPRKLPNRQLNSAGFRHRAAPWKGSRTRADPLCHSCPPRSSQDWLNMPRAVNPLSKNKPVKEPIQKVPTCWLRKDNIWREVGSTRPGRPAANPLFVTGFSCSSRLVCRQPSPTGSTRKTPGCQFGRSVGEKGGAFFFLQHNESRTHKKYARVRL